MLLDGRILKEIGFLATARAIEPHVDPMEEIMNGEGEMRVDRETTQVLPPFFPLTFDKTMHYSAPC
jgi:hypothetical protein